MLSSASKKFFTKENEMKYLSYKKKPNLIKFIDLIKFGILPRPHYALGLLMAAHRAQQLGYKKISVFEFGCWNCRGLLDLEHWIDDIKEIINIDFQIFGFDYGEGLPDTNNDPRDRFYRWSVSDYKLVEKENIKKLKYTKLIFGDVKDTLPIFIKQNDLSSMPIGFVAFDMDYFTSTYNALKIFNLDSCNYIPRPITYFDDLSFSSEYEGESLAIKEFNKNNKRKLSPIGELAEYLSLFWKRWIFLGKRFHMLTDHTHPKYNEKYEDTIALQICMIND